MPGPHNKQGYFKPKNVRKTLNRIIKYMSSYRLQLAVVALTIIISAGANVVGIYFLKPIINQYIVPFIGRDDVDMRGFASMMGLLAAIYLTGVLGTYVYNRLMVNISTGTLKKLRVDLFTHMETLPIKFFDTHTHGELMSRFTNDIDSMREMLSQGIPNLFQSAIMLTGVFMMMLLLSPVSIMAD